MKNEELSIASKATIAILVVVIVATFSYMLFFSGGSTSQAPTVHTPDSIELYIQAQEFVRQGLKAPSTAEFPSSSTRTGTDGKGIYQVIGYVDSENSFGAMIRSDWMVNMRFVDNNLVLEKMSIGNKLIYDATTSNWRKGSAGISLVFKTGYFFIWNRARKPFCTSRLGEGVPLIARLVPYDAHRNILPWKI